MSAKMECYTCNGYGGICCGDHNNDACQGECKLKCQDCDGTGYNVPPLSKNDIIGLGKVLSNALEGDFK